MAKTKGVQEVANLACLKIDESKISEFQEQLDKVVQYFDTLGTLETEQIEPMVTPHDKLSELRADEVKPDLDVESLLENAPEVKDSLFKVPPVV